MRVWRASAGRPRWQCAAGGGPGVVEAAATAATVTTDGGGRNLCASLFNSY